MSNAYIGKPIGARKLTWFPLINDPETGNATYGEPVKLSRLINITVTPVFAEGVLESDDGIEDDLALIVAYDVTINASQLTDSIRAALLGHQMDDGDGMLVTSTDVAQWGALAWEELLSKKDPSEPDKYKKVILYKGKFREFAETAATMTQGGVTFQTHNLTGRFVKRNDGHIKYSIREDSPNADATKLANWFVEPQEFGDDFEQTVATPVANPAAGAVVAGTLVELTTATSGASIRYTLNGSIPNKTSTLYDGPILITQAMTIKAIAYKDGMNPSEILTAAYTINES
ncbi:MAG TPA: FN3 associated domain-containing protein [Thermoclostridium caenicola]|uniref:major tail protein n=1 Tax=Thermoclostridium caenicola TaxID=659425 RepID=UPI002C29019E|nr:major tail protein [Thermoclostridium caenicola]HPO77630.1 FN3 associated domain-containing protein [Thermoclostridium caenicola]